MKSPVLAFALPVENEARWSDLLAVLVATDPVPFAETLGLHHDPSVLTVHREVALDTMDRPDMVLTVGEDRVAVIEVKVLADLGTGQLARYEAAEPGADVYALLYPGRLVLDLAGARPWRGLTWESVLTAYASSGHPWVADTARAWLDHLKEAVPAVGPDTIWNDLRPGEDFAIALRARMSWLFIRLQSSGVPCELVLSTNGKSWIVRLRAATPAAGYEIMVEVEEYLDSRAYPECFTLEGGAKPRGPTAKVCLHQEPVTTSAGFAWDHLLRLWPVMEQARSDWVTNVAKPKADHDREGHARLIAAGAPPFLGIGHGEAQAKSDGFCMFGARVQFRADTSLAELSAEVARLRELTLDLARIS